jgi:hypothetical protein
VAAESLETSPALQAILAADRRETAAALLAAAFASELGKPYPSRSGARLGEALGELAGIRLGRWSWSMYRPTDAALARLILECVLLWEGAGLACRGLAIETTEVVLLGRGESALGSADPRSAVLAALARP